MSDPGSSGGRVRRPSILLVAALLASCGEVARESGEMRLDTAEVADPIASSTVSAVDGPSFRIPPDSVLIRRDVCPFECCRYGVWVARSVVPVFGAERSRADTVTVLQPGDSVTAETGDVHVTALTRVVVTREVREVSSMEGGHTFVPGDTLFVLDYLGEGFYSAWMDGEMYQPEQFWTELQNWTEDGEADGYSVGDRETEWWVRVRTSALEGWINVTNDVSFDGADTCG
jgi:hypothetical protein